MMTEQQAREFGNQVIAEMMQEIARVGMEMAELTLTSVTKTNANDALAVTARFGEEIMSPSIPVHSLYEEYRQGTSMKELAEMALRTIEMAREQNTFFDVSQICKENATKHLFLVVINKELNAEMAMKVPHLDIPGTDLMAVPRWEVALNGEGKGSILVKNEMLSDLLHMTSDEVLRVAKENTIGNERFYCKGMSEIMEEMMYGQMPEEMMAEMLPSGPEQMYVLSNVSKINGATVLMSKDALAMAKDRIGEDYYIICSSIHEVIAVPRSCVADPAELRKMNREVNATQVEEDEILGNQIFLYNGKLNICNDLNDLQRIDSLEEGISEKLSKGVRM